jgi:predicted DsbA family dithiol-disulfide isomerase
MKKNPGRFQLAHRSFVLVEDGAYPAFTEYHLAHRLRARELTGLPYGLPPVGSPYPRSSLPSQEAAQWAQQRHPEQFDAFDGALYEAFFRETKEISDPAVLSQVAVSVGLDGRELEDALARREYRSLVLAQYEEGLQRGVRVIPTVFIGDTAISGAASLDEYERAARALLAAR